MLWHGTCSLHSVRFLSEGGTTMSHSSAGIVPAVLFGLFVGISAIGFGAAAESATPPSGTAPQTIRGSILNIEGEMYSIKDISGHEVQLRVTKDTKVEGGLRPKVGDRIEVQVAPDGQAISVALVVPDAPAAAPVVRQPAAPPSPAPSGPIAGPEEKKP